MAYEQTVGTLRDTLCRVFTELDCWFDRAEGLRSFRPADGGWSIDLVLEHVTLTNRFLLLTLGKMTPIAERRARNATLPMQGESELSRLDAIGQRGSFGWPRPEHMEPTGIPASGEVRATMQAQLGRCLALLERLDGGVGSLCRVTMTVNVLGRIDLYQWLYFLAQHGRRHLQQLEAIAADATPSPDRVGDARPPSGRPGPGSPRDEASHTRPS